MYHDWDRNIHIISLGKKSYDAWQNCINEYFEKHKDQIMRQQKREKRKQLINPLFILQNAATKIAYSRMYPETLDECITPFMFWRNEYEKCLKSEEYFYNNYFLIDGKKPKPVPEGYFKSIRIIKARRFSSHYLPPINNVDTVGKYLRIKKNMDNE